MRISRIFLLFVSIVFSLSVEAYNAKDLRWHTDCLVNCLLTGDDLDEPFVKKHLSIGCDEEDIQNVTNQDFNKIYGNFYGNLIIQPLKEEIAIVKFKELSEILKDIYEKGDNPKLRAACIIVEKEVSRSLFGVYYMSLKGEKGVLAENAKKQFLDGLEFKKEENLLIVENVRKYLQEKYSGIYEKNSENDIMIIVKITKQLLGV